MILRTPVSDWEEDDHEDEHQEKGSDDQEVPQEINFHNTLAVLLAPYMPAANELEADDLLSTMEIMSALERHYGICQGDPDHVAISGNALVNALLGLGYKACNTGSMQLNWMMKRKSSV